MSPDLDTIEERLARTLQAVAQQVPAVPPQRRTAHAVTHAAHRGLRGRRSALAACVAVIVATVAVYQVTKNGDDAGRPHIAPSQSTPETATLPRLLPGIDTVVDQVSVTDLTVPEGQPIYYRQLYMGAALSNPTRLQVSTTDFRQASRQAPALFACDPSINRGGLPLGQIVDVNGRQGCLEDNRLAINWAEPDGLHISMQASGISAEDLLTVARNATRRSDMYLGVTFTVPLPAGLQLSAEGADARAGEMTEVNFHQGTCKYSLSVSAGTPGPWADGAVGPGIQTETLTIHGTVMTFVTSPQHQLLWTPTPGTSAMLWNQSSQCGPDQLLAIADGIRAVDENTWQGDLTNLGEHVRSVHAG